MTDTPQTIAEPEDDEISLLDLLQVIVDNLRLLVFGSLGVGVLALIVSSLIPPTYTAKTQFLPPQQQQSSASALLQSLGAMGGLAGAATGLKNPADQFVGFLKSASIQDGLVERFKLQERYDKKFKVDTRKELENNTKIAAGKDGIISVEFDDRDPQFAADVANGYVQELRKLMGRLALTEAQLRRTFFEGKLQETKDALAQADQELRATGINASSLKSSPVAAVEVVARVKAGIVAQEVKIGAMRGYMTESSPEVKQAMVELSALRAQLTSAEKAEPQEAGQSNYVERYRNFKYQETLFELFAKQYELARVDEGREGSVVQVVDVAQPPEKKSKPKKALIALLATVGTGFLLLIFVFVRNAIRNASQTTETQSKLAQINASLRKALGKQ
ncbi:MAG: lipopolysaccharide biosynthesis protein [Comamonadaceae bacterium PBBC2]|nr:MAG: lipopolysaccharide biosynthesis protein [Comamonadaceae bacterium PBBC2]